MKLTKAQRRTLRSTLEGAVARHFDIWVGYWWTEHGKKLPCFGKSEHFPPLPIRYLLAGKLIEEGGEERLYPGRRKMSYRITPAGRRALQEGGGDGK